MNFRHSYAEAGPLIGELNSSEFNANLINNSVNRSIANTTTTTPAPQPHLLTPQYQNSMTANITTAATTPSTVIINTTPTTANNYSNSDLAIKHNEDTYGVFASDEDPKIYQRRFKYYQRLRKQRKQMDVQSDIGGGGFYKTQYAPSSVGGGKAMSDSGRNYYYYSGRSGRSHDNNYSVQSGEGGGVYQKYTSQRGMGDGYSSDLDIYKHGHGSTPALPNSGRKSKRPTSGNYHRMSAINGSSTSSIRPANPPSYNTAMLKRTPETKRQVAIR